jgi:ATP-binding cassette subfamily B protein
MSIPVHQYWSLLARYLRPLRARVLLLAVLLLAALALQLVGPQILRRFIDAVASQASVDLVMLALLFVGVALADQIVSVLARYATLDVGWRATNSLRRDLVDHCLSLDLAFHNAHTPGEMIERVDGDVGEMTSFLAQFVIQILLNGLLLVGILVLLFIEHWMVGLSFTAFALVSMLALWRLRSIGMPHWQAAQEADARLYGYLEERLTGTQDVRALGAVPYVLHRFYGLMSHAYRRTLKAGQLTSVMFNLLYFLVAAATAVALVLGAYLYDTGQASLGTVFMIFYYAQLVTNPIHAITSQLDDLQHAGAAFARVGELLETRAKIEDGPGVEFPPGALSVELEGVTFGYELERPVLRNIDLRLEPGTVLGLLGRTGSGKTTITRLILRFYDPQEGAVRLGGHDLRCARTEDIGRHVAMVTQNVQLFAGTIRDNLTLFDPTIPDGRILAALEDLGLSAWYGELPEGMDTLLPSGGGGLSAGEAQLLAFARVFLRDPGLVILDEASSRLDPATEALLERAIDKLIKGRTVIVIAHRLSTVERVDQIAIVEDGRIVEHGARLDLAAEPSSRFSALLRVGLEEVRA